MQDAHAQAREPAQQRLDLRPHSPVNLVAEEPLNSGKPPLPRQLGEAAVRLGEPLSLIETREGNRLASVNQPGTFASVP